MTTSPVAFLFDADFPTRPIYYGGIFDEALLRSLAISDPEGRTRSSLMRGDLLLRRLATITKPIVYKGRWPATQHTVDPSLFDALVTEFVDSLMFQWNSLDLEVLAYALRMHNLYCLSLPALPSGFKEHIDQLLRDTSGYLGAVEFDLGNPIHRYAFMGCLLEHAVIHSGQVLLELDIEGDHVDFDGAESFTPGGRRLVEPEEFENFRPAKPAPFLSERGSAAVESYKRRLLARQGD